MHRDVSVPTETEMVGWIVIGTAASLAAMAWPFSRRARVMKNLLLGAIGGVTGALGTVVLLRLPASSPACLAAAAGGSLVFLLLGHLAWIARAKRARTDNEAQPRRPRSDSVRGP